MSSPSSEKQINTPGAPDPNFGKEGQVIATSSGGLSRVLSDGSTLTVGITVTVEAKLISVRKYTPTGTPDINYGAWSTLAPDIIVLVDLLLQPDGKPLLLSAQGDEHAACITRFNVHNGDVDQSFGNNGTTKLDKSFNPNLVMRGGIAVQATGHILAVFNDSQTSFFYQLDRSGHPSNFGNIGPIEARNTRLDSVLVTDSGFVAAGSSAQKAHIVGLLHNGELNSRFGSNGLVELQFTNNEDKQVAALAGGQDGQIVVVGGSFSTPHLVNFVAVLLANGKPNPPFNGGKPLESNTSHGSYASVLVQPDEKIVVLARNSNSSLVNLIRYTPTGTLDTTFGQEGIAEAWNAGGRPEPSNINLVEWVTFSNTLQSSGILSIQQSSFIGRLISQ